MEFLCWIFDCYELQIECTSLTLLGSHRGESQFFAWVSKLLIFACSAALFFYTAVPWCFRLHMLLSRL